MGFTKLLMQIMDQIRHYTRVMLIELPGLWIILYRVQTPILVLTFCFFMEKVHRLFMEFG
jgi:hypothetical protein